MTCISHMFKETILNHIRILEKEGKLINILLVKHEVITYILY